MLGGMSLLQIDFQYILIASLLDYEYCIVAVAVG